MKRDFNLGVRLNAAELEKARRLAAKRGLTPQGVLRWLLAVASETVALG
jgi:hypothetical protein